jgi:uncharacterized protein
MPYEEVRPEDVFKCQKCGDCCKGFGGTYVTEDNIREIAAYIHTDDHTFINNFCQMSGGKPVIAVDENGWCIFFDEVCTIHPVKPKMCKAWPFIQAVLVDINNWHIMAGACMGIRTDLPDEVIRACVQKAMEGKSS